MVGQALWYAATVGDAWVALLGWAAAALKCRPRDAWIGWPPALQWRRLPFVVNNVRFCLLPGWAQPNLASQILARTLRRLNSDWEGAYGHPVLLAETFVDAARFRSTCYRAAGWQCLGVTRGFAKRNTGYVAHGHPKTVWVRPLRAGAVVALAVCAAVAGARSFTTIAQWARGLSPEALRRLGATRRTPPSEPTIRRVLQQVDADRLDAQLGPWLLGLTARAGAGLSVEARHADYVFTVKGNQPTLRDDIAALRLDAFPPGGHDDG